ncbi:MAG: beta-lactamase family protein [Deltaproteobacteria bacterium]|nr:beta-lactamase family protein [Deltaproteobacteria bacterium]
MSEGVFPSGSAAVAVGDKEPIVRATAPARLYDIASLTKVFVATVLHRLRARGSLDLDASLGRLWPDLAGLPVAAESVRALLSHRSGLPAWLPLYATAAGRDVVMAAARAPTDGPRPTYSDLGFILLGALCERISGCDLPDLLSVEVLDPLGLPSVRYGPVRPDETHPTGHCVFRDRPIVGEVNDENAAAMGGISGHAGLFARVEDVCRLGSAWLSSIEDRGGPLPADLAREATTSVEPGAHALGWDTTRPEGSSAGSLMGPRTFGHLGFTGCSLWVDPDARVSIALLTNRVHPTRDNLAIRAFRPAFHDTVMRAVLQEGLQDGSP